MTFSGCRLECVNADQVIVEQSVLNDSESKIQDANRITVTDTRINQSFDATALTSILMQRCENDEGYSPRITLRTPLGDTERSTVDVEQCEFHGDGDTDMRFISWAEGNFNATHLTLSGGVTVFRGTLINLEHCFVDDSSLTIEGVPDQFGDSFSSVINCRFDAGGRDPKTILKGSGALFEDTNFNRMYLHTWYTDTGDVELKFENCTFINSTDPEQFFIDKTVPPALEADPLAENFITSWADGDVTVRDCQFIGGKGGLWHWKQEGYEEVAKGRTTLEGCSIDRGTGIGAKVSSEEVVLNNNTLTNNGRALMIMHGNIATITNNTIDGTKKTDEGSGIYTTYVPNLNFYNNTIRNAIGSAAVSINACSSFFEINMLVLEDCEAGLRIGDDSSINEIQITGSRFKNCGEYSAWLDPCNRPVTFDNCVFEGKSQLHIKTTDYQGATATPVLEIRDCEFRNGEGYVLSDSNRLRHVHLLNNRVHDWSSRGVFDQRRITSPLKIVGNSFERITGERNTVVVAGTSGQIEIRDNQFSECENALQVRNCADPQIINNGFDLLTGVAIDCTLLTGAKINDNSVDTACIGIRLDRVDDSTISNNTMRKCQGPAPVDGDGSGLYSWSASNIVLESNVSSENIYGYYCGGADNLRFTTCDAANNQKAGFHIGFAYEDWYGVHQNCELVNCSVDGNGTAGVVLRPEGEGHVIEGGVYKNSPVLIDNQGTDNFGLEHVRLEDAGEIGVQVRGEVASGGMNRCYFIRCPLGALLDDVQNVEVNRNRFQESGETALRINKGSGHVVIHSQFDNGGNQGVVEQSASNIRYTYNAFLDNNGMGFYRKDAAAPGIVEKCTFRANFLGGIVCENLGAGRIEKNALLDNGLNGMRLSGCTNMTITQNRVMRNKDAGLDLGSSTGNRIYDNSLRNDKNAIATALNTWNLEPPVDGTNIIGGPKIGGNEWNSYIGEDTSGDGLGDTLLPHTDNGNIQVGGDQHPLLKSFISPEKPDRWPVLNEICPPTEDAVPREWVEIANPGAFDQSLGGWQVVFNDGESTFTLPMTGPDWDGVLESKGFLVIHLQGYQDTVGKDIDWPEGANLLGDSGASVTLLDAEGNQRDDVQFGTPDEILAKPDPGNSLARDKDSFDMDLPFDWDPNCGYDADEPTPGRANIDMNYTLTVNSGTGSGAYEPGEVVNIAANDPAAGKEFDKWTGDTTHVVNVNSSSTTVTMPAADVTVTATYKDQPVATYTLTVNSGTGDGEYTAGSVVAISANAPPAGKVFDKWTGDTTHVADVNSAETTVAMLAADVTVTATYKNKPVDQVTLTVSVSPVTGGSVTGNGIDCPGDCTQDYDENTNVQLTATAANEMTFLRWEGAITGATNPDSLLMNTDKQVTAYFGAESGNTDTDGFPDGTESGPAGNDPSYDGDGNGIPDYQEAGAASLPSSSGGAYATLAVPTGSGLALNNVQAQANPSPGDAPADVRFPYGFFRFRATGLNAGACTTVTLYLPLDETIDTYYKYGPTTENPTDHWYEFLYNGRTGAQIFHEGGQTRIVLHLCDGERGDNDLMVNGEIDEPGAPGIRQQASVHPVPTLSEWGMMLFMCLMLLGGLWFLRRSGRDPSAIA